MSCKAAANKTNREHPKYKCNHAKDKYKEKKTRSENAWGRRSKQRKESQKREKAKKPTQRRKRYAPKPKHTAREIIFKNPDADIYGGKDLKERRERMADVGKCATIHTPRAQTCRFTHCVENAE